MSSIIGYKLIKDTLVTILGDVASLKSVYGKEEKNVLDGGLPAACVSAKEHSSQFNSVGSGGTNERVYQHYIRIYFRTDEKNDADYEDVLESVADDVVAILEKNVNLNGICEYALPTSGVWTFDEHIPARVFELVMSTHVHIKRDTGEMI